MFNSFRELLIKKAEGNPDLQVFLKFVSDGFLAEEVFESLEKAAHKGDKANSTITGWAGSATSPDVNMLHDALSHHLTKFAAANKARPPKVSDVEKKISMTDHSKGGMKQELPYQTKKVEMDPVAHQHLERAMHLADLAARASKHSLGKMNFDHVPTHAWEMNETSAHQRVNQHGQKKYADDQQGLKRRLQGEGAKRFENYGYLMQDPHEKYANKGKLRGHSGQYPFEEMKVNDKHVHIDHDAPAPEKYEAHPFDSHPMFAKEGKDVAWERSESSRSDADREKYAQQLENWHESPEFNKWLDDQEAQEIKDPQAYKQKGMSPSKPLLEGVKRGEHVKVDLPGEESQTAGSPEKSQPASPAAASAVADKPQAKPEVRRREPSKKANDEAVQRLLEIKRAQKANPNDPKLKAEEQAIAEQLKGGK